MPELDGRLAIFRYVAAEKAGLYRALMGVFVQARERFALHLRPAEVQAALGMSEGVDAELLKLVEWGNLESHPDTAEVSTVEEFNRPRFLYQMTPEGEAAEQALAHYLGLLEQTAELQSAALGDIHEQLRELEELACSGAVDPGKVHRVLSFLCERLEGLTSRARAFLGSVQRAIDLHGLALEQFCSYKEALLDYLERFIQELIVQSSRIAETLERLDSLGIDALLEMAADRDLQDVLAPTPEDRFRALERWRGRWAGLRAWFLGRPGERSQSELLRRKAVSSIPALLTALQSFHDRRLRRSDRHADLVALAGWFARCDTEADAHRLWRAAFALAPARHLGVDAETLASREARPVAARTSWLEAPPIQISPRLRNTGRHTRRGRPDSVIDRSEARRTLLLLQEQEAVQLQRARARLATGRRVRLSELGHLEPDEFGLFLDLLGEALAAAQPGEPVETLSSDGTLLVRLEPTGCQTRATIRTRAGELTGPDYFLTLHDLLARAGEEAAG